MIQLFSHIFLQDYWWFIVSLLASMLVFLMFVQGGQTFIFSLPSNESQRSMIVNAMGRKWEFTFTTLVTFGGAFFASFPLFYTTSFGGAYWVWMIILFSFIIQAVAYEFRSKSGNVYGTRTFDIFLLINGAVGPFLIGVAVATFFTGSRFALNDMNQVTWLTEWRGLEALASFRNLSLGMAVLMLARMLGLAFIIASIDDDDLLSRLRRKVPVNAAIFLFFFLFFVVSLMLAEGFAVDAAGIVSIEKYKYLHNLLQQPMLIAVFLIGVILVLLSLFWTWRLSSIAIWAGGAGTLMTVLALMLLAGYNGTSFYPSLSDLSSSLTIRNASSSRFTLNVMFYVSLAVPFVIAYIWIAWKALTSRKINAEEMGGDDHKY